MNHINYALHGIDKSQMVKVVGSLDAWIGYGFDERRQDPKSILSGANEGICFANYQTSHWFAHVGEERRYMILQSPEREFFRMSSLDVLQVQQYVGGTVFLEKLTAYGSISSVLRDTSGNEFNQEDQTRILTLLINISEDL